MCTDLRKQSHFHTYFFFTGYYGIIFIMFRKIFFVFLVFFFIYGFFHRSSEVPQKRVRSELSIGEKIEDDLLRDAVARSQNEREDLARQVDDVITETHDLFSKGYFIREENNGQKKLEKAVLLMKTITEDDRFNLDAKSRYFLAKLYMVMDDTSKAIDMFDYSSKLTENVIVFEWNSKWGAEAGKQLYRLDKQEE